MAGVALLDIGSGTTDLLIFKNGAPCFLSVIPLGGNHITRNIMEFYSIDWSTAEKIKIQYGSSVSKFWDEESVTPGLILKGLEEVKLNKVNQIIHLRIEELLQYVVLEIDKSGLKDKLQCGLVITGGGSLLKNLTAIIKTKTGMDARIGYPLLNLYNFKLEELNNPIYASCLGLIINGFNYQLHS